MSIKFNEPNYTHTTVKEELNPNQPPLGSKFKSYELTEASNYYTLDPFQYSITKFKFNLDSPTDSDSITVNSKDFENDPGLVYKNVNIEKLIPSYTSVKKSVNDFPAQSYHRFTANEGYFNPNESLNNSDLWFYGADQSGVPGLGGPALNVQEVKHIIFPEAQRGGLDSRNLTKYSWTSQFTQPSESWEAENKFPINNNVNCQFFNYNSGYTGKTVEMDQAYAFDSNYCRSIGISAPYEGSMPFNPNNVF